MLEGLKIGVVGAGRSGRAAAKLAQAKGGQVTIYDQANIDPKLEGVAFVGAVTEDVARSVQSDMIVLSPGIDTYGSLAKAFSEQTNELIGEVELASRYYGGRIVGITGTNGKTTTTELVELFVKSAGQTCLACGNYGVPVAEVVLQDEVPEVLALELSSFQLETTEQLHIDVAIWLNFAADHMDRYPTIEAYRKAKERILLNVKGEDYVICRVGENLPVHQGRPISFSSQNEELADWKTDGVSVSFAGEKVVSLKSTRLRGRHNAENVAAALAAVTGLGLNTESAQLALDSYKPPSHRCEFICEVDGVEYLNDSKATNLHALESAVNSLPGNLVLICGGKEKGLDYSPLHELLPNKVRAMICIGEIGQKLVDEFSSSVHTERAESLEKAVAKAQSCAESGDTVLFSPGTSSFDMFTGYEDRGESYRRLAKSLRNL